MSFSSPSFFIALTYRKIVDAPANHRSPAAPVFDLQWQVIRAAATAAASDEGDSGSNSGGSGDGSGIRRERRGADCRGTFMRATVAAIIKIAVQRRQTTRPAASSAHLLK